MMGDTNITVSLEFSGKSCKSAVKKNIIQSNLMGIIKYVIPLQVYKVVINAENKSWFIFRRYNEFHSLHEKVGTYLSYTNNLRDIYICTWGEGKYLKKGLIHCITVAPSPPPLVKATPTNIHPSYLARFQIH